MIDDHFNSYIACGEFLDESKYTVIPLHKKEKKFDKSLTSISKIYEKLVHKQLNILIIHFSQSDVDFEKILVQGAAS